MEPLSLSLCDNNVENSFNKDKMDRRESSRLSWSTDDQNSSKPTINHSQCMFPNKIKYIFEDDDDEYGEDKIDEQSVENDEIAEDNRHFENAIIINMDENYHIENVHLISDHYQLLNFSTNEIKRIPEKGRESLTEPNNNDEMQKSSINDKDLVIDVISTFKDLNKYTKDLPLDKLIDIYKIQNKQLSTLYDSI